MRQSLFAVAWVLFCAMVLSAGPLGAGETVGVLWDTKSPVATSLNEAFLKAMKQKAPDIEIEVAGELPSLAMAIKKYSDWQKSKSAVVFLRSTGASAMAKNPPSIPGFCGGCSNPATLGCMTDMNKPDKNITGVTYYIPAEKPLDIFKKLVPGVKTIGLIIEPTHPSAKIDVAETTAWAGKNGVTVKVIESANAGEVIKNAKAVEDEVDFFVLGNQALVANASATLVKFIKKPIFTYIASAIELKGAACGMDIDNNYLGEVLADSVIAAVKDKKPVSEIPVKLDPKPQLKFVDELVAKFNLTVPAELQSGK